ncbi:unnamed protein product [Periconia digitata]|uniref:Uncharacterized protein n=1 Tax=Periconia digitata TaxID=1303443 RepID=A0A9W4XJA5_9PLEO|nr:unnamed protein product [Periconia digitata]
MWLRGELQSLPTLSSLHHCGLSNDHSFYHHPRHLKALQMTARHPQDLVVSHR